MEETTRCETIEEARNKALRWLEEVGGPIGPYYQVEIGRLHAGEGAEVGISSSEDPYRRIRLDYDPVKGPHYNVEVGKASKRRKHAFCFPGTEEWITRIIQRRAPR